ncbi:hypothetical protein [Kitasatospora sp. NPDC057198]|uniref:hypothetical protein n=1 Tax=Kitasatospora sp. NPDC057198 TaxID=3346046 RepID=UPI00363407BA
MNGITRQEIGLTRLDEGGYRLHWQTTGDPFIEAATGPVLSVGTAYGYSSRTKTVWMEVGEYPGRTTVP